VKRRWAIKISDLVSILPQKEFKGNPKTDIAKIEYDSRLIKAGDLFVALVGGNFDGHDFIPEVISSGAAGVVCEKDFEQEIPCKIIVPNSRHALALLAAKFYGFPSKKMKVAGITGTNGKTTTCYMVKSIFEARGKKTGLLGTIEYLAGKYQFEAFNTTPESLHIERLLSIMRDERIRNVVMEVSSHALTMERVRMIDFNVAAITNLTQDHLDYHKTMEEYREAKALLFDKVKGKDKWAILNMDDPNYDFFLGRSECSYLTYSLSNARSDLRLISVEKTAKGFNFRLLTPLGEEDIQLRLKGRFNLHNSLCAAAVAMASGVDAASVKKGLEAIDFIPGRLEKVECDRDFSVYVDYAHTHDALAHVMQSAKEIADGKRLIAVFGCGGDRDKEKRPLMSRAVSEHADVVFLTSDNPRTEDPEAIIEDARAGLNSESESYVLIDRREAIAAALKCAQAGDVIVIAGKGHENYQIIGTEKIHFDDREIVREVLKGI
jgi:UDP-N-acetylmuramoyl-L-alanyl-D-glutamate--2,6-diaminopimelate ligase